MVGGGRRRGAIFDTISIQRFSTEVDEQKWKDNDINNI